MYDPILEEMLNTLLPFSKQQLKKNGEFYPHAISVDKNANIKILATYWGDEHPSSQPVIDEYIKILRTQYANGEILGGGIALDAKLSLDGNYESDAVTILLEHKNAGSISVSIPYQKKSSKEIEYMEPIASIKKDIWFK